MSLKSLNPLWYITLLLICCPPLAAQEPGYIVLGAGVDPSLAEEAAAQLSLEGPRESASAEGQGGAWLRAGMLAWALAQDGARQEPCLSTERDFSATLDAAQEELDFQNIPKARQLLAQADRLYRCTAEPIPQETLARYFLLRSVQFHYAGRESAEVYSLMEQALTVDPELPPPEDYEPAIQAQASW